MSHGFIWVCLLKVLRVASVLEHGQRYWNELLYLLMGLFSSCCLCNKAFDKLRSFLVFLWCPCSPSPLGTEGGEFVITAGAWPARPPLPAAACLPRATPQDCPGPRSDTDVVGSTCPPCTSADGVDTFGWDSGGVPEDGHLTVLGGAFSWACGQACQPRQATPALEAGG